MTPTDRETAERIVSDSAAVSSAIRLLAPASVQDLTAAIERALEEKGRDERDWWMVQPATIAELDERSALIVDHYYSDPDEAVAVVDRYNAIRARAAQER
jgi:hypothetical protein